MSPSTRLAPEEIEEDWSELYGEPPYNALARKTVDNRRLREAVRNSALGTAQIAARLGWMVTRKGAEPYPDSRRLERALGLRTRFHRGVEGVQEAMAVDSALRICDVIGADPKDMGLL